MKKNLCLLPMVVAMASAVTMPAYSKQTVFSEGDRKVDIGGRAHFQYIQRNPDNGESTEDIGFRRLRIEIDAYIDKNWGGQIEWDFGEGSDLETNASINNAVLLH